MDNAGERWKRNEAMSANRPNRNADPPRTSALVVRFGRDSFWAERHSVEPREDARRAHKKWQCLACGECGFVEMVHGEERLEVIRRVVHGCQPESIVFYSPGAHRPLTE